MEYDIDKANLISNITRKEMNKDTLTVFFILSSFLMLAPVDATSSARPVPTNPLMKAVDVVRRYMSDRSCGLHDGHVYAKIAAAKHTYVYLQPVEDYINAIMGDPEIANEICTHADQLIKRLSHPWCRLIQPIKFDYNYVEVIKYFIESRIITNLSQTFISLS